MSPTRRSFVKAATATLPAAAFTWPAPTHATVPSMPVIEHSMVLLATTPDGHSHGKIVLHSDGRVEVVNFEHHTLRTFTSDELVLPGAFLHHVIGTLRVTGGDA